MSAIQRQAFFGLLASLLILAPFQVHAVPTTWKYFGSLLTDPFDPAGALGGSLSAGDPFFSTLTYESSTPASSVDSEGATYAGAITGWTMEFGAFALEFDPSGSNFFRVSDREPGVTDSLGIVADLSPALGFSTLKSEMYMDLFSFLPSASLLDLPLPPDTSGASIFFTALGGIDGTTTLLSIEGATDTFFISVAEPGAFFLLVIGLAGIGFARRARA